MKGCVIMGGMQASKEEEDGPAIGAVSKARTQWCATFITCLDLLIDALINAYIVSCARERCPTCTAWSRSISDGWAKDFKIYVHRAQLNQHRPCPLGPIFASLLAYVSGPFSLAYGALKERQR